MLFVTTNNTCNYVSIYEMCKERYPHDVCTLDFNKCGDDEPIIYEREVFAPVSILKYQCITDSIKGSDNIKEIILKKLQNKKCIIILNCAHEPYPVTFEIFEKIVSLLKRHNIQKSQIIVLSNSVNFKSERCEGILHIKFNFFEAVMRIEGLKHFHMKSTQSKRITKKFLCLNRALRDHRVNFVYGLWKRQLLKHTACSMRFYTETILATQGHHNIHLSTKSKSLYKELSPILPLVVDNVNEKDTCWNAYTKNIMHACGIYIVTETLFDSMYTGVYHSEKVYKPILYKVPFLVVGQPYTLSSLRDHGYLSFENIWDEGYDTIIDNDDRINFILNTVEDIAKLPEAMFNVIISKGRTIAEENYNKLINSKADISLVHFLQDSYNKL